MKYSRKIGGGVHTVPLVITNPGSNSLAPETGGGAGGFYKNPDRGIFDLKLRGFRGDFF